MNPVGVWYWVPSVEEHLSPSERDGRSRKAISACCVLDDFVGLAQIVFLVFVS
jgi:hypothetical protein